MRRALSAGELHDYDPEPERAFHRRRREQRETRARAMEEQQQLLAQQQQQLQELQQQLQQLQLLNPHEHMTLGDYVLPRHQGPTSGVVRPPVGARNFELKPSLINMVQQNQFGGLPTENPHQHLNTFLELMDTVKIHEVSDDALYLRAFSFSLRDRAKAWFKALPQGTITTWDELAKAFLTKYFPPKKTAEMRNQISSFQMKDGESLYEGWERFKELLLLCPHHGQDKWVLLHTFYNAVDNTNRLLIDASSGGTIMKMHIDEAWEKIEEIAQHTHYYNDARSIPSSKRASGLYEVDNEISQQARMEAMAHEIKQLKLKVSRSQFKDEGSSSQVVSNVVCQFCGEGDHTISSCQVYASRDEPQEEEVNYMNNFNRGPRNDPYSNSYNPGWRNHPNLSYGNNQAQQRPPPGFRPKAPLYQGQPSQKPSWETAIESLASSMKTLTDEVRSQGKNLKIVEQQLAQQAANVPRPSGQLPGHPEVNPRGQLNAVTLRSGKQLEDPKPKVPELQDDGEEEKEAPYIPPPPFKPPLSFPQRKAKAQTEKQFGKFLEVLKKLYINIPFTDALQQMPAYVKFLKEILSNKRKIEGCQQVSLNQDCSALVQNKFPPKLGDPGSFCVPIVIGNCTYNALCDLGASVGLIPLSICEKLDLGEPQPVDMTLFMADRSTVSPTGILEDIPIQVGKFYVPVDFIVLDMQVDFPVPIILGRPFLATAGTLIDVKEGVLSFSIGGEKIEFSFTKAIKQPSFQDELCRLDLIDRETQGMMMSVATKDPLEEILSDSETSVDELEMTLVDVLEADVQGVEEESLGAPKVELKPLPSSLRYEFLGSNSTYPVIVDASLSDEETAKLLNELKLHSKAIGYTIDDLKGINPSLCMHRILLEDDHKPSIEHQRRLNPNMKEVVRKEVLKLLDADIIYSISDSPWVSPVHVVPKKGGMTVVRNENNELIPTRTVTGWRMCIDYRKLNKATRKDHFPLPFIDQMLERLAKHTHFCYLDGYSGFFQIPLHPDDQEKTTFTCPYGTFAYRRMPFGLCNAPATFQRCMMAVFSDFIEDIMEVFMDDFSVYGTSFDACLANLSRVLQRCEEANLVLN